MSECFYAATLLASTEKIFSDLALSLHMSLQKKLWRTQGSLPQEVREWDVPKESNPKCMGMLEKCTFFLFSAL